MAKPRIIRIVVGLTRGLKVFVKSTLGRWWNPLATNRALYRATDPSGFRLIRNTHLHPMIFCAGWEGTRVHVELCRRASYSSHIAWRQCEDFCAWVIVVGSLVSREELVIVWRSRTWRGLKIPLFERVVIGWLGTAGCVIGKSGGEASTGCKRGWDTSMALGKESCCVSEDTTSVVGETCEEGRGEGMGGVESCWTGRTKECGSSTIGLDGVGGGSFKGILQEWIFVGVVWMVGDSWFWNGKADSTKTTCREIKTFWDCDS